MRRARLILLISMILTSVNVACVSVGNQVVKDRITIVNTTTKLGRVVEMAIIYSSLTTHVFIRTDDGSLVSEKKTVTGWTIYRPDVAIAKGYNLPRISGSIVVMILMEDGKRARVNIGGWYVKPPPGGGEE